MIFLQQKGQSRILPEIAKLSHAPPSRPPVFRFPSARRPGGALLIANKKETAAAPHARGTIKPTAIRQIVNILKKLFMISPFFWECSIKTQGGQDD